MSNKQAITLKTYPASLSLTCLICSAGALQGTLLTLVVERGNTSIWAIQWDTTFLSYVYSVSLNITNRVTIKSLRVLNIRIENIYYKTMLSSKRGF